MRHQPVAGEPDQVAHGRVGDEPDRAVAWVQDADAAGDFAA